MNILYELTYEICVLYLLAYAINFSVMLQIILYYTSQEN